jgi:uncharacterized protein (TIGR00725 family)
MARGSGSAKGGALDPDLKSQPPDSQPQRSDVELGSSDPKSKDRVATIFGSYSPRPGEALYELAYRIGYDLAKAGYVVCNGGYDGTMEASCRGAKDAGGRTIGVTCAIFSDYRGKPLKANPYVDQEIVHSDVFSRIQEMMRLGDAFVVLEGGTGTLAELAIVWEFVCKGLVDRRPIVVVGDFWTPLVDRVAQVRPKHAAMVTVARSPQDVIAAVQSNGRPRA